MSLKYPLTKIAAGLTAILCIFLPLASALPAADQGPALGDDRITTLDRNMTVYFFYGDGGPHCEKVIPFITNITQKFPEVTFIQMEIYHNAANRALYDKLNRELNVSYYGVPEVFMGETVLMGDKEIPAQLEQVIRDALEQAGLAVTQTISIGNGDSFDFTIGNFRLEKNLSAGADGSSIMNMDVSIKDSNASNVDIVFMTSEIRDSRGNGRSCDSPNWCKSLVFMDGIKPGESRTRTSKVRLFSPPGYDNLVTETFLVRGYLDYMVGTGPIYGGLKYNEWVVDLNNKTLTRKY